MVSYPKPNIVISRCLEFDSCRYNSQMIRDEFTIKLADYVNFFPVCPEVEVGLGVPRSPIRLVDKAGKIELVQPETGANITDRMDQFAESFLSSLKDVDGFILKDRSPSCGPKNVRLYINAKDPEALGEGSGLFAAHILKLFPDLAVEDEDRLKNLKIRSHFLIQIFTFARYRAVQRNLKLHALVEFHSTHKFLFMAYNQEILNILGNIVANHEKKDIFEQIQLYEANLHLLLKFMPTKMSLMNISDGA